eukprot:scaffold8174_cov242-Prasinococcus_capsulatus_cf.AAC.1
MDWMARRAELERAAGRALGAKKGPGGPQKGARRGPERRPARGGRGRTGCTFYGGPAPGFGGGFPTPPECVLTDLRTHMSHY